MSNEKVFGVSKAYFKKIYDSTNKFNGVPNKNSRKSPETPFSVFLIEGCALFVYEQPGLVGNLKKIRV